MRVSIAELTWQSQISFNFLFEVSIFANFDLKSGFEVTNSLDFLFQVMVLLPLA